MMRLIGVLRTPDCVFTLSPKITTVGRENCDLVIQNSTVDEQHAIIEYSESEDIFILRDLDTSNGTYVNECRIQNASVRLTGGDTIRFGFQGVPHEFSLENPNQQRTSLDVRGLSIAIYPPVSHSRPTWQASYNLRGLSEPSSGPSVPLPSFYHQKAPVTVPQGQPGSVFAAWTNVPHPPAAARPARPSSAGRRQGRDQPRGGWIGQPRSATYSPGRESPLLDVVITDKPEDKDSTIDVLREQVASLHAQMNSLAADANVRSKLVQLEAEVSAKRAEVVALRDRLQHSGTGVGAGAGPADSLELTSVRSDLERLRKDKQIASGLVQQLQKDLTSKDATISRLTRQIESIRLESEVKDSNINNLHNAVLKEQERTRIATSTDARDKELHALRQKFRVAEGKVHEQSNFIQSLKNDLEAAHAELRRGEQGSREVDDRLREREAELLDLQRVERIARVDLQESSKRYERLRNRTMQIAFSVPGAAMPGGEVKDDQLIEMLRRILDERNDSLRELKAAQAELESRGSLRLELSEGVKSWVAQLEAMHERLAEAKVPSSCLAHELTLLGTEAVPEPLQGVKDALLAALRLQLTWHEEVETALASCGVNTKLSSERPRQHILDISEKFGAARTEGEELRARLEALTRDHEAELERITASLVAEKEEALKVAGESAELGQEEQMRIAVEAAVVREKEKFEAQLEAEKVKMEELSASVNTLQQSLVEKQEDCESRLKEAELSVVKVEVLQATVNDLERELALARADAQKFSEQAQGSRAVSKASGVNEEAELLRVELGTAIADLKAAHAELATLEEVRAVNAAQEVELDRLRPFEENARELHSTVGSLEVVKVDLEARVEALTAELEGHLAGQTDASSRSASRLLGEVEQLTGRIQTLESNVTEVVASKADLEVQLVSKSDLEEQLGAVKAELEAAITAKTDFEAQLASKSDFEAELSVIKADLEVQMTLKSDLEAQLAAKSDLEAQLAAKVEELELLQAKMDGQDRASSQGSRRGSATALRQELDASLERSLQLSREVEALRDGGPELQELKEQLQNSESAVTRLVGELELARSTSCHLEEMERLRTELQAARAELQEAQAIPRPHEELEAEVEAFRHQVRQHSKTICALEERLEAVMKANVELQGHATDLKKENRILRKKRANRAEGEVEQRGQVSNANAGCNSNQNDVVLPRPSLETASLERSILALRQENANLKKELNEKARVIEALRHDLSGAAARLSDVRSELMEDQKQAVTDAVIAKEEAEVSSEKTLQQMNQMSIIVDELRETHTEKDNEIKRLEKLVAKLQTSVTEQTERIAALKKAEQAAAKKASEQLAQLEEQGRISSELSAAGAQCRGERHDQIINHQKDALAELRMRVKKLEQVRAPSSNSNNWNNNMTANIKEFALDQGMPSHDQAVQQVVLLKKELAEIRSRQALQETRLPTSTPTLPAIVGPMGTSSNNLVNNSYGTRLKASADNEEAAHDGAAMEGAKRELDMNLEHERSAHRMTMSILEDSENAFLDLLRAVAISIDLESVGGMQSLAHLAQGERMAVMDERFQTVQKACQRIKVLKERLDRKESMMANYEQDLVRLQQAEELAQRKHQQIDVLVQDIRQRTEEAELLRESLNNTKEILSREKMLNNAIKQKKTFHMEVPKMPKGPAPLRQGPPKFHCPPPDVFSKSDAQKKKAKDRDRRKDFEIETLKSKLTTREEELCRATTRLANMETTLGLNGDEQQGT